jgi:hypothetical protein
VENYLNKFNYKTDFFLDEKRQEFIKKEIDKGSFYVNEEKIIISREYKFHERTDKFYNKEIKKGRMKHKDRRYYSKILRLCEKYYYNFSNVIEIGAGTGFFSKLFIDKFSPKRYTAYEFSKSADIFREKVKSLSTEIILKKESFKNVEDINLYDCVIALEIFEHINWDKEFLLSIPSDKWVFFSVPVIQDKQHVRAFLTPDSIAYRYKDVLNIYEILESVRDISHIYKNNHYYPTHWAIAAKTM